MKSIHRIAATLFLFCACAAIFFSTTTAVASILINFETDGSVSHPGSLLINGQSIYTTARAARDGVPFDTDTVLEFGKRYFNLSATIDGSGGHLDPAIFDSDPATNGGTGEKDLLVGLGNVLLLQDNNDDETTLDAVNGLLFDVPDDENDDEDRGSIVFDFLDQERGVELRSLDIIDADGGFHAILTLTDVNDLTRTYTIFANWTKDINKCGGTCDGYGTLLFTTLDSQISEGSSAATAAQDAGFNPKQVKRLNVLMDGSGAIDNFHFVPEPTTTMLLILGALAILPMLRQRYVR